MSRLRDGQSPAEGTSTSTIQVTMPAGWDIIRFLFNVTQGANTLATQVDVVTQVPPSTP
ncbi:MAG TPA: hypothetical protein VFW71_08760 [Actinomycetota bacterium]|nr:hypothetical protein [Actinomycetota bacterium]